MSPRDGSSRAARRWGTAAMILLLAISALVLVPAGSRPAAVASSAADSEPMPAPAALGSEAESTAMATLMTGLISGVGRGAGSTITTTAINWGLTALGLGPPGADTALKLQEIEETLQAVENELADIEDILQQQSCQNAAAVIQNALNAIDIRAGRGASPTAGSYLALVRDAQGDVDMLDMSEQMADLFEAVLNGDQEFGPLEHLVVELDNALRDQGNAEQLISACGLLIDPPDASTAQWDDRPYFQQLIDLVGYYAEYQARAALVITEAYHWKALQAWIAAEIAAGNDPASLPQEDVASICNDPTGDVLRYCVAAADAFDNIRTNLRAQYGEAGAPYSSGTPADPDAPFLWDPAEAVVQIDNGTGYVWVKDIDDFFEQGGYSTTCRASTSAKPCGPGVGNYDHTTFEHYGSTEPMSYGANGGYTTWRPAPVDAWEALTGPWSGSGTTFAMLMEQTHGFSGASTPRVYFTGEAVQTDYRFVNEYVPDTLQPDKTYRTDVTQVACFVATPMNKGNSEQPFCASHVGNLVHTAQDHVRSPRRCVNLKNTTHGTLDDAGIEGPFFTFLFNQQHNSCRSDDHPLGWTFYPGPPGWLLQYATYSPNDSSGTQSIDRSHYHDQYHWPVLDANAAACTTEPATGATRSRYALHGRTQVPRMCGADFDAWFEKWVAPPAPVGPAPEVPAPGPVLAEVPEGATADRAPHEVTTAVHFDHLLVDDDGVTWDCSHDSGMEFQLGTTTVRCTATGAEGGSEEHRFPVHVRYPFEFRDELADGETRVAAGRSLEIAFHLHGDRGGNPFATPPQSRPVDCASGEALGELEPVRARGRRLLDYHRRSKEYRFDWKTDRAWRGQCRELVLEMVDGSVHTALITFRPR